MRAPILISLAILKTQKWREGIKSNFTMACWKPYRRQASTNRISILTSMEPEVKPRISEYLGRNRLEC